MCRYWVWLFGLTTGYYFTYDYWGWFLWEIWENHFGVGAVTEVGGGEIETSYLGWKCGFGDGVGILGISFFQKHVAVTFLGCLVDFLFF